VILCEKAIELNPQGEQCKEFLNILHSSCTDHISKRVEKKERSEMLFSVSSNIILVLESNDKFIKAYDKSS